MKKVNLSNRSEFYASDSLLEMAVSKKSKCYINLAYTDYGGTFLDKTLISYFEQYFPESIISEHTSWNGKNAFIFGKMAIELADCLDNILSFRSFEDYYSDSEFNEYLDAADYFIKYKPEYSGLKDQIVDYFFENCSILTSGVDYCDSDLIKYLESIKL